MTRAENIRQMFALLERQSGVSVSFMDNPEYASAIVTYQFPNGAFIKILSDRSDFYVDVHRAQGVGLDLARLCKLSARYGTDYSTILNTHWVTTIAPWIGIKACP